MLRSFKSLKFSSRGTLSSLTADRQVLALTLLNVMFLCRRSTLVTAFCQKTQSLQRRVNRKASSSSGRLPLPSETWALKGNAHAYMIQYSYILLFSQVSPTDFWYFSPFQHIQTHHVSCWGANHWWLPWRGPIKWEAASRGCQDRIPCDDKGSPWRRREGEWAWKILKNFDKVTSGDMKEPFGCEHCVCVSAFVCLGDAYRTVGLRLLGAVGIGETRSQKILQRWRHAGWEVCGGSQVIIIYSYCLSATLACFPLLTWED